MIHANFSCTTWVLKSSSLIAVPCLFTFKYTILLPDAWYFGLCRILKSELANCLSIFPVLASNSTKVILLLKSTSIATIFSPFGDKAGENSLVLCVICLYLCVFKSKIKNQKKVLLII